MQRTPIIGQCFSIYADENRYFTWKSSRMGIYLKKTFLSNDFVKYIQTDVLRNQIT